MEIKRGEVYWVDLDPIVGSEQGGIRPVVVLQNDIGNKFSTTTIAAVTTKDKRPDMPTHIHLDSTVEPLMDSVVLLEQIRTIDKQRLIKYIGKLSDTAMKQIDEAYLISIGVVNMLRNLLRMKLITEDEYNRTVRISAEHYGVQLYCV